MELSRRNILKSMSALAGASFIPLSGQAATPENELNFDPETGDLAEIVNLFDFEKMAEGKMTKMAYEFVASGAADEFTVRWNRQALDNIKIRTRVLNDVSIVDTKISLMGLDLPYPILISPTAYHKMMHPEGEVATARGASAASALYCISSYTTTPLEEISKVATMPLWFQLYVADDRNFTKEVIQKAEANGCKALVVTVDTPVAGVRNRQQRVNFKLPDDMKVPYLYSGNHFSNGIPIMAKKPVTWKDIEWFKTFTKMPILLKGIMGPEDAALAIKAGAAGIIVSNHSGRNLDTVPATIEVLPAIVDEVKGKVPVLMDGGIRRGTDVLKAIALGANAVLVGKPICFGLASGGAEGVTKVLTILRKEFEMAMALSGRTSIAAIDRSLIWKNV